MTQDDIGFGAGEGSINIQDIELVDREIVPVNYDLNINMPIEIN
jgi:hypothetical protein